MGNAKHTVYISKTHDFMYFDDRKVTLASQTSLSCCPTVSG